MANDKHEHEHPHADEHHDVEAVTQEMDTANRALSEALRISFTILKIIMVIVFVAFLGSGVHTIGEDEEAIVLRFGKMIPVDAEGNITLGSGLKWVWPYPINEVVRIPAKKQVSLVIDTFWYFRTPDEILGKKSTRRIPYKLNPLQEGYCLVRGEQQDYLRGAGISVDQSGSDYNIIHSMWQVVYKIQDVARFFKNVEVRDIKPGEIYYEAMTNSIQPLIKSVVEDAVVDSMVFFTIDEAIESQGSIPRNVQQRVQKKLDDMETGITIVSLTLDDIQWPRQVDDAFNALIAAKQTELTTVEQARTYRNTKLNETAGAMAEKLVVALHDDTVTETQLEDLWAQAQGQVSTIISDAKIYRTRVVESARSQASYFEQLLPEFRQRPALVMQSLYIDTLKQVLSQADETFVLQPTEPGKKREVRVLLNRDPALKTKKTETQPPSTGKTTR
jgi:regulator of protease activity HflC (stomatin/prohibitin superfamily)